MTPNWKEHLTCWKTGCYSERAQWARGTLWSSTKNANLHLGPKNLKQQHRVGTDWLGNSSAEKEPGGLGARLNSSQQRALAATTDKTHPVCCTSLAIKWLLLSSQHLRSLCPRRGQKPLETGNAVDQPCSEQEVGPDDLHRSLPLLNYCAILRCFHCMHLSFLGFLTFSFAVSHTSNCQITYGVCRTLIWYCNFMFVNHHHIFLSTTSILGLRTVRLFSELPSLG